MKNSKPKASDTRLPYQTYEILLEQVTRSVRNIQTYGYFLFHAVVALTGLVISLYINIVIPSVWTLILSAIVFAFFSVQLGLLGHDLSHQQVFKTAHRNTFWAVIIWGLGCGLSESRWYYKHNNHHQGPNHIGHDPDIDIPFVFSDEQIQAHKPLVQKYILPYQHYLFWIGLCFVYPYNILHSMRFLLTKLNTRAVMEISLMSLHFILLFNISFTLFSGNQALLWNSIVFLVMGLYMGLIFAPNHKGEEVLAQEATYNWVYQITFTRNIKTSSIGDYIMGGLQFQIEHHLFPHISRFHYRAIQKIVKTFCQKHSIPYHETSWITSMHQIHQALKAAIPKN